MKKSAKVKKWEERNGNTVTCVDLTEVEEETFILEYDSSTHTATAVGAIKIVFEFSSDGSITYSLFNPQTGQGDWVLKGHKE